MHAAVARYSRQLVNFMIQIQDRVANCQFDVHLLLMIDKKGIHMGLQCLFRRKFPELKEENFPTGLEKYPSKTLPMYQLRLLFRHRVKSCSSLV